MEQVTSKDGTKIAFDRSGGGPPIILVGGALNTRSFGPNGSLAPLLARHFTVFNYDRRGRGDSGDTLPWAVEREIEDIEALIEAAGGLAAETSPSRSWRCTRRRLSSMAAVPRSRMITWRDSKGWWRRAAGATRSSCS
jgi:hypothetical protein